MAVDEDPSGEESGRAPHGLRARFYLWIVLLGAVGLGLWVLAARFPGQVSSDLDGARLVHALVILTVISGGIVLARRVRLRESLRNALIWLGLFVLVVLGVSYRDEFRGLGDRLRTELLPGEPVVLEPHVLVVTESDDGHFRLFGEVNGTRVNFLVDTGASDIVLSPADAARIGIDLETLQFTHFYETANGRGWGASLTVDTLSVGPIRLADVPVSVNQAEMSTSLLGMTFLRRLQSFEIRGRKLILRWE